MKHADLFPAAIVVFVIVFGDLLYRKFCSRDRPEASIPATWQTVVALSLTFMPAIIFTFLARPLVGIAWASVCLLMAIVVRIYKRQLA